MPTFSQEFSYFTTSKAGPAAKVDFEVAPASTLVTSDRRPDEELGRYRPLPKVVSPLQAASLRLYSTISNMRSKPLILSSSSDHVKFKCPVLTNCMYEPLPVTEATLRLLYLHPLGRTGRIEVSLTVVTLADNPVYTALSYEWGSEIEQCAITVNGHFIRIRKNLYPLLLRLCPERGFRKLWVDAICIDQNNTSERNSQVQMMGDIYKGASTVIAWLGAEVEYMDHLEPLLPHLNTNGKVSREFYENKGKSIEGNPCLDIAPPAYPDVVAALRSLLQRSYWSRAWILQEILLGQEVILMCGDEEISWAYLYALKDHPLWSDSFKSTIFEQLTWSKLSLARGQRHTMETLIEMYPDRKCADPRDQIYSLLSIDSTYKAPKRMMDVDYDIDCQSLLFRTFNQSIGSRNIKHFERLRVLLGVPWDDILDPSKVRFTALDEPWLDPQHPWTIFADLGSPGTVNDVQAIRVDGHDLVVVTFTACYIEVPWHRSIARFAEVGDVIVEFAGSSLGFIQRIAGERADPVGTIVQGHSADELSEEEHRSVVFNHYMFEKLPISISSKLAVAQLNVDQWRAVCACPKDRQAPRHKHLQPPTDEDLILADSYGCRSSIFMNGF